MTQEWKRKSGGWPSRKPWWTIAALVLSVAGCVGAGVWQSRQGWTLFRSWTGFQRLYFGKYVRTWVLPGGVDFRVVERVDAKGRRDARNEDLSDPDVGRHKAKFQWGSWRHYENKKLYTWLKEAIYEGRTPWAMLGLFRWLGGIVLGLVAGAAIRADVRRWSRLGEGHRLRGPELLTPAEFNRRNKSEALGFCFFVREKRLGRERLESVWIPRALETMHTLIMGDSGTGKSVLIKHLLMQVEKRGDAAIVYDPALEYTPRFYRPERGDIILDPLDARMPYWNPADEVRHAAEAATIAESLFPDTHRDNPFFVEGTRKVFAHLLTFKPSPQELVSWLANEEEIDRRVQGTPLASMVYAGAQQQRGGMLASLSMIADSMKLLPAKEETGTTWSAVEWAKERRGWIFLTSTPEYRKPLRPLISLWLDLLVLRLMTEGLANGGQAPRTWFVLDELASLQKLPQLHTAITENRKSGSPVVLGFQGRSQLETRYGHDAEAMLSQPATKVLLRISEPHSAEWASKTIGEVEMERVRESRSNDEFPNRRATQGRQLVRAMEPLVMPSQIQGLQNLHGYLKSRNFVVELSIAYLDLPKVAEGFIPRREMPESNPPAPSSAAPVLEEEPAYFE